MKFLAWCSTLDSTRLDLTLFTHTWQKKLGQKMTLSVKYDNQRWFVVFKSKIQTWQCWTNNLFFWDLTLGKNPTWKKFRIYQVEICTRFPDSRWWKLQLSFLYCQLATTIYCQSRGHKSQGYDHKLLFFQLEIYWVTFKWLFNPSSTPISICSRFILH